MSDLQIKVIGTLVLKGPSTAQEITEFLNQDQPKWKHYSEQSVAVALHLLGLRVGRLPGGRWQLNQQRRSRNWNAGSWNAWSVVHKAHGAREEVTIETDEWEEPFTGHVVVITDTDFVVEGRDFQVTVRFDAVKNVTAPTHERRNA